MWTCIRTFFRDGIANQVMLFERSSPPSSDDPSPTATLGLPPFLTDLLATLEGKFKREFTMNTVEGGVQEDAYGVPTSGPQWEGGSSYVDLG